MKVTPNFTLEEFTASRTADIRGINNSPSDVELRNILWTAWRMEIVRVLLGNRPIIVTSGFRSAALNKAVGGSPTSDHATGLAVDIRQHGRTPKEIADIVQRSGMDFDQIIVYRTFVHFGFGSRMRKQRFNG